MLSVSFYKDHWGIVRDTYDSMSNDIQTFILKEATGKVDLLI